MATGTHQIECNAEDLASGFTSTEMKSQIRRDGRANFRM